MRLLRWLFYTLMKQKTPYILIIILLTSFVYSNLNQLVFASVDDKWQLLDEKLVKASHFNLVFLYNVFTRINSAQYSPVNTLYYYFIYQINGFDAYWFHLFSFMLHLVNVGLVYVFTKKIASVFEVNNAAIIAYAVASIWAVLPFNVEAVAWISASKIMLYAFWGLISLICFFDAYQQNSRYLYFTSLISFVLSFLSKEQAVLFPLVMVLLLFTIQKRSATYSLKRIISYTFPFVLLSIILGVITLYVASQINGPSNFPHYPFSQRIILVFYCMGFYVFNLLIPVQLHFHYPFPTLPGQTLPLTYYIFPFAILLMIWQLINITRKSTNSSFYFFCAGVFILHLLLCIQIFPLDRAAMLADRYMYMPSLGLLIMLFGFLSVNLKLNFNQLSLKNTLVVTFFAIYVLFLAFYSHTLVAKWETMSL